MDLKPACELSRIVARESRRIDQLGSARLSDMGAHSAAWLKSKLGG
jgi:hypothetical protein